jgi:hypothetical protein
MEKNFNKEPFSVGEKKIESTWEKCLNFDENPCAPNFFSPT